ncbi:MAG: hypothetical protein FWE31_02415 [Firmicutes bacterium]|nr:hypothetical protein [Bacillota bacterium]
MKKLLSMVGDYFVRRTLCCQKQDDFKKRTVIKKGSHYLLPSKGGFIPVYSRSKGEIMAAEDAELICSQCKHKDPRQGCVLDNC